MGARLPLPRGPGRGTSDAGPTRTAIASWLQARGATGEDPCPVGTGVPSRGVSGGAAGDSVRRAAGPGVDLPVGLLLELRLEGGGIARHRGLRHTRSRQSLDGKQQWRLIGRNEARGTSAGRGAGRPPNAVDVILRHVRQVEVDDMSDVRHVDAPRRDVGGDEHADATSTKVLKGALTLALGTVGMDAVGPVTGAFETPSKLVRAAAGPHKNEGAIVRMCEQLLEKRRLLSLTDPVGSLGGPGRGGARTCDLDADGRFQVRPSKFGDLAGHSGGEEQCLSLLGKLRHHPAQLRGEAHVQHSVRFVEDKNLDVVQPGGARIQMVDEPAGRGDEQRAPFAESAALPLLTDSANDDSGAHARLAPEDFNVLGNLESQLPGGRQYQCARSGLAAQSLKQWK